MARFKSTVSKARPGTASLKTTVPTAITRMLGLQEGDVLYWDAEAKKSKFLVTVQKK